jgi:acyl carrier protein
MTTPELREVVLASIRAVNETREPNARVKEEPDATLFGPGSALDSLGLVNVLLEIEDGLRTAGVSVTLSDDRAMSRSRSPFRSVPSLMEYIGQLMAEAGCPLDASS